jgi:hypothetical protein
MVQFRSFLLILLIISLLAVSVTAQVDRTITTVDDGLITVHISLPEGMIGGITEEIPTGFTYLGTTHPANQTERQGEKIHFAIIGEDTVTYTLRGDGCPEIKGFVLDLTSGEESDTIPAQKSPAPAGMTLGAILITAFAYRRWMS